MAAYFRNDGWKEDVALKEEMAKYVKQGFQRRDMLDFLKRDFAQYAWSLRTVDRRLRHFDIQYNDKNVSVEEVKDVVKKELDGPGKLLGYRAMHRKVRQVHDLNVPRDLVHAAMYDLDPKGLEARGPVGKKKTNPKGSFTTKGPNWVHSLDGHDKLMGYQNSTFPLAVYGCIDTASRKLLWLRIWVTNSDPKVIGRWYLEYLYEARIMPSMIRLDRGTETGTMATIHAFLRRNHDDMDDPCESIIYGPSTSNQIERWWRELHEKMEKYFKEQLNWLKDRGHYNPHSERDRMLLAFLLIPVVQRELDLFRTVVWNSHKIRTQKDTALPDGIPDHIYNFPETYGLEECGWPVTEDELKEAALHSDVLSVEDDFLDATFRSKCEEIIPYPNQVQPNECKDAFLYLKEKFIEL